MTDATHTPGPWYWVNEADGNLIAAAPELLEALETLNKAYDQLMPGIKHISVPDYALLNDAPIKANAAIAKAKGES